MGPPWVQGAELLWHQRPQLSPRAHAVEGELLDDVWHKLFPDAPAEEPGGPDPALIETLPVRRFSRVPPLQWRNDDGDWYFGFPAGRGCIVYAAGETAAFRFDPKLLP